MTKKRGNGSYWISVIAICSVAAGLSGCQGVNGTLASMNNGLAQMNTNLSPGGQVPIMDAGAPVSPAMAQAASDMVLQSAHAEGNASLQNAVQQAQPAINAIMKSWMSGLDCRGTEMYANPGNYQCGGITIGGITPSWPYNAPRNIALKLISVGGWRVITANSFSFVANFCSPVSQTCVSISPTLINMGEGWQIELID